MLASDMSEAKTRVIRIVDADAETMRLLCEYIYTGTLHERPWDSSELSACLLQAAAKYQVNGLVRWCSAKIAQTLVVDTVAEWLVLASQIGPQAEALKSKCLSLAASNLAEVQGTEGWQRFMKNPRVVSEVAPQLFQAISPPHPKKKPRRAGGLHVEVEKPGLLPPRLDAEGAPETGVPNPAGRRPADIWVANWGIHGPAALDLAVTCGLRPGQLPQAAAAEGAWAVGPATDYEARKRAHLNTAQLCAEQGLQFLPIVAEGSGGRVGAHSPESVRCPGSGPGCAQRRTGGN
ncbi:unnamed protein product, partial [Effrenium voratum]